MRSRFDRSPVPLRLVLLVITQGPFADLTATLVAKRNRDGDGSGRMGVCCNGATNDRESEWGPRIDVISTSLPPDSGCEGLGADLRRVRITLS